MVVKRRGREEEEEVDEAVRVWRCDIREVSRGSGVGERGVE